jgi:hypothetical protein
MNSARLCRTLSWVVTLSGKVTLPGKGPVMTLADRPIRSEQARPGLRNWSVWEWTGKRKELADRPGLKAPCRDHMRWTRRPFGQPGCLFRRGNILGTGSEVNNHSIRG